MQACESKVAEVRKALEPLSDVGIVERVRASGAGGYLNNETGRLDCKVTITVTVAGRSAEKHYPEIHSLGPRVRFRIHQRTCPRCRCGPRQAGHFRRLQAARAHSRRTAL